MKNRILVLCLLIVFSIISDSLFSQIQEKGKSTIKPALLVIDIQNAYLNGMAQLDKDIAMPYINYYIDLFRTNGYPVIRIYHYSKKYGPEQGTDEFEFPSSVVIKSGDPKIIKTYPDGFNKTDLNKILQEKGVNTVFLCGLSAVGCILATWIGAQNNDYNAFMIKDAIMSHNSDYTNQIEVMFDAVGPDVINLILENSPK
jgi:nicotinamidase-related amidase